MKKARPRIDIIYIESKLFKIVTEGESIGWCNIGLKKDIVDLTTSIMDL